MTLSIYGISHGARAGLAQTKYFQLKYGKDRNSPEAVFKESQTAHRLYPHNYYLCLFAAKLAYNKRFDDKRQLLPDRLNTAAYWCDTGLDLNYHKKQLRHLKAFLIKEQSITDAIVYWKGYVKWQFWNPFNHAILVQLYSEAGDFQRAMQSLAWVKGSEHYTSAKTKLNQAWKKEMTQH